MIYLFPHGLYWLSVIAATALTIAIGIVIDRLYTRRTRYARQSSQTGHLRRIKR